MLRFTLDLKKQQQKSDGCNPLTIHGDTSESHLCFITADERNKNDAINIRKFSVQKIISSDGNDYSRRRVAIEVVDDVTNDAMRNSKSDSDCGVFVLIIAVRES